jgi:hypothetical protein
MIASLMADDCFTSAQLTVTQSPETIRRPFCEIWAAILISHTLSIAKYQSSVISHRSSGIGHQSSVIIYQCLSPIINQRPPRGKVREGQKRHACSTARLAFPFPTMTAVSGAAAANAAASSGETADALIPQHLWSSSTERAVADSN